MDNHSKEERVLVVMELVRYNDLKAAARLASYCELPQNLLPCPLQVYMEENTE